MIEQYTSPAVVNNSQEPWLVGEGVSLSGSIAIPSLDFNFVTDAFPGTVTFTRASSATFFDSAGVLQSAANNVPRFDYNPATLAAQGLLIEESRTNLLTYSEALDTTPNWVLTNSTITANATSAPDGSLSADKWIANSGATSYVIFQVVSKSAVSTTYSYSLFAKQAELSAFRLYFNDAATTANRGEATFDLSSGTTSSVTRAGTFTNASANIQSVGNGWYRCSLVVTTNIETSVQCRIAPPGTVPTGDGTSGLFLWGAQLEAGAFPTSYIPTTTTALTRSADVASVTTLSPWYNAAEGTIYAESLVFSIINQRIASFNDGSVGNRIIISRGTGSGGNVNGNVSAGGSPQVSALTFGTSLPAATITKAAFAYKLDDFAGSVNGSAAVTDTSGTIPTVNILALGSGEALGTNSLNGYLRRITYYNTRLPNAQLQALTAP